MKKLLILCAMSAALFACNKADSPKVDPTKVYEIVSDNLGVATPSDGVHPMVLKVTGAPVSTLENIEITESGLFLAYANSEKKTKASDSNIVSGTYSITADKIVLTVEGYKVEIPLNVAVNAITSILINSSPCTVAAAPIVAGTTPTIASICRTWYPKEYHASIMSDGTVLYNKIGKDVMSLQDDLFTYVLGEKPATADLVLTSELEEYTFTNNKTALVKMAGNEYEVCTWSEEGADKLRFTLNDRSFVGTPYFKAGNPNTMFMIIDIAAAFDGKDTDLGSITVNGRLVITLVDAK